MRISLLDPGAFRLEGHHFNVDCQLFRALTTRGHEVALHSFIRPQSDLIAAASAAAIPLYPTFRVPTFYRLPFQLRTWYRRLSVVTAQDLASVPQTDLWLWPTFASFQLMAAVASSRSVRQIFGAW